MSTMSAPTMLARVSRRCLRTVAHDAPADAVVAFIHGGKQHLGVLVGGDASASAAESGGGDKKVAVVFRAPSSHPQKGQLTQAEVSPSAIHLRLPVLPGSPLSADKPVSVSDCHVNQVSTLTAHSRSIAKEVGLLDQGGGGGGGGGGGVAETIWWMAQQQQQQQQQQGQLKGQTDEPDMIDSTGAHGSSSRGAWRTFAGACRGRAWGQAPSWHGSCAGRAPRGCERKARPAYSRTKKRQRECAMTRQARGGQKLPGRPSEVTTEYFWHN